MFFPYYHFLYQSVSPDTFWGISGTGWSAIAAIGTLLAVIVALVIVSIQDWVRRRWNRTLLDMNISLESPDSHSIDMTNQFGQKVSDSFYIRVKVSHDKGIAGENVEIMSIKFVKVENGKEIKLNNFLPISLVWSHFKPRTNVIRIPIKLFRHCDFGHFIPENNTSRLILDTIAQPNKISNSEYGNIFSPGKYRFTLLLSGDNVRQLSKTWEIEFNGWNSNEDKFRNSIIFYEIK